MNTSDFNRLFAIFKNVKVLDSYYDEERVSQKVLLEFPIFIRREDADENI